MKHLGLGRLGASVVMLPCLAGCATIATFIVPEPGDSYIYGGARADIRLMKEGEWVGDILPIGAVTDFPLSAALDTILLPITIPLELFSPRRDADAEPLPAQEEPIQDSSGSSQVP